ncbi:hypothetical protein FRX31_003232 [Thalictrum thalictroides]|uniref:DUF4283 domain-containing protein n=1 Tax=Thalictrum thalictroides TaxID=46969 RepID=A0A7J6XCG4_THATH|nr:hypothetical protein FRX31_003232 [Thalictrum thalictroides]
MGSLGEYMQRRSSREWWRRFTIVELKSFDFERRVTGLEEERVQIKENGRNGRFTAGLTEKGAQWLGELLCTASNNIIKPQRFNDEKMSILGVVRSNKRGVFLEVSFSKNTNDKRGRAIRFPAGRGKEGWADLGLCLLDLFHPGIQHGRKPEITMNIEKQGVVSGFYKQDRKMAEREDEEQKHDKSEINKLAMKSNVQTRVSERKIGCVTVEIGGTGPKSNFGGWVTSVIGEANTKLIDWRWVRSLVEKEFVGTKMFVMDTGEAIFAMASEREARKLGGREKITENGVEVRFRMWTPEFQMLKNEQVVPKQCKVTLVGIPVHLKSEAVVKTMMEKISNSFDIDRDSLNFRSAYVQVTFRDVKIEEIPRIVFLEEEGVKFPVLLEVGKEMEEQRSGNEGDSCSRIEDSVIPGSHYQRVEVENDSVESRVKETGPSPIQSRFDMERVLRPARSMLESPKARRSPSHANRFEALAQGMSEDLEAISVQEVGIEPSTAPPLIIQQRQTGPKRRLGPINSSNNSWNHSLVLSKRMWPTKPGAHNNKTKSMGNRKALAQKALEALDSSVGTPVFYQKGRDGREAEISGAASISQQEQTCPERRNYVDLTSQEGGESRSIEFPPGFEGFQRGPRQQQKFDFDKLLENACCKLKTKKDVWEWVRESGRPIANFMGLSMDGGGQCMDNFLFDMAMAKIKNKGAEVIDGDEVEIDNYMNSNEVLKTNLFING